MTVLAWIRLTVSLWLLRKAVKIIWWLVLALLALALWPVTLVTAAGYAAAWLRGWPAARLRRTAAATLALPPATRWPACSSSAPGGPPCWLRPAPGRSAGITCTASAPRRLPHEPHQSRMARP